MAKRPKPVGSRCLSVEQDGQQRDGEHRQEGGDERYLRDECRVAVVLQAEDGAVSGNGHRNDEGIDVDDIGIKAQSTAQIVECEGDEQQSEKGCRIDRRIA